MKLFLDTGSIKDIETIAALGILDGVTTDPSLLAKEAGDFRENLKKICGIVKGPVSGEVTATDYAGMMREGHDIAKIDEHMVVKVPLTSMRKTVPPSGHYVWAVDPSSRPVALIAHKTESWTLTCGGESRQVTVGIGERVTEDLTCP